MKTQERTERTDYQEYEREKAAVKEKDWDPKAYEKEIRRLAEKLKL